MCGDLEYFVSSHMPHGFVETIINNRCHTDHTHHPEVSDDRCAFLMGNTLVCGVVEVVGKSLYRAIYNEEPVSSNPIYTKRNKYSSLICSQRSV